jgi:hypothetical protein
MSDTPDDLPPEIEEVVRAALLNGTIDAMDELMVRMLVGLAQVYDPEGDRVDWTETFLRLLGSYRDSWMERALVVVKQEIGFVIDTKLAELREGLGDAQEE